MPDVLMRCGCRGHGYVNGEPYCLVHGCADVMPDPPLEGRTSLCGGCGAERPSSLSLAFFVYRGPGSPASLEDCSVCSFARKLHPNVPEWSRVEPHEFVQHGSYPTDRYYCGCRGWD